MKCPLMSYRKQGSYEVDCLGDKCVMAADGAGQCLIKQALQCYVSEKRTEAAEKEAMEHHFEKLAQNGQRSIGELFKPPGIDTSKII